MILLWGLPGDPPTRHVREALDRLGASWAMLDQRSILETDAELSIDQELDARVRVAGTTIELASVTAAYLRPHDVRRIPPIAEAGTGSAAWQHALAVDDALATWAELAEAFIVSRPSAMASNGSKPYQAQFIRGVGFEVPATLLTTDPDAARHFRDMHEDVVYKSISGVRSIVARLQREDDARLEDVVWCPTQFQEYVPGIDHRVHVVGREVFACEILSSADDYRYASRSGRDTTIRACELPPDVAGRCVELAAALSLPVAGVDLRLRDDDAWYCFEVNPSPAFTYYQQQTGQPIGEAIARLLAKAGG